MTIQAKHSVTKSQMTSQIPNCPPLSWIRHLVNLNSPSWISKSLKNKSEHQKIKKNYERIWITILIKSEFELNKQFRPNI